MEPNENSVGFGVLDFPCGMHRLPDGTTIIADAGDDQQLGSELLIVDKNGQITWNYHEGLKFAHSAVPTSGNSFLVTDTTNNRVVELTRDGDVTFTSDDWGEGTGTLSDGSHLNYPNDAHPLTDGRMIITDRNNDRCIIVTRGGDVEWEYSTSIRHPHNADPLGNGNVIIADSDNDRVIEVSPEKEIVWSFGDNEGDSALAWPRDADRLENGNTLICDSRNSRVVEVTPDRKIVWQYSMPYFANPYEADRLESGNTLISDQQHQRIVEVDPSGTIVWEFRNYRPTVLAMPKLANGGLKEKDKNGMPASWRLMSRIAEGGGKVGWSEDERGRPYPILEFDRGGALAMYQLVAVQSGKRYRLAAELATTDMDEGSFACLQLAYRDDFGGWFEDVLDSPKGNLIEGTTDFAEDVLEVVAPEGARTVEVRIMLVGPGKVHVRRVMMFQA